MSLQVEKLEKNMAKLTIEASAEEFEAAVEKAYQKAKKSISLSTRKRDSLMYLDSVKEKYLSS